MKYSVIGPRGVVLASGLTLKQAETYCANCGGKVTPENPAPKAVAVKKAARKNPAPDTSLTYHVELRKGDDKTWTVQSVHRNRAEAFAAAQFLASRHPGRAVHVMKRKGNAL